MRVGRKIWILEDDPGACFVYDEALGLRYEIEIFPSLELFEKKSKEHETEPHLIIADLRLPDGNFLEFLGSERYTRILKTPFIIVSSTDDLDILRTCFNQGASDYLTKPFTKNEIIVKIERLLSHEIATPHSARAEIILDPMTLKITKPGRNPIQLTAKEHHIFSLLYQAAGTLVQRRTLQMGVWGETKVSGKALDVHILHLRKKLAEIDLKISFIPPDSFQLLSDGVSQ